MGCGGSKDALPVPAAPMQGSKPAAHSGESIPVGSRPAKLQQAQAKSQQQPRGTGSAPTPDSPPPARPRPTSKAVQGSARRMSVESALQKKAQEDMSLEQQAAAQYRAYEEAQRRKAVQEDVSIEKQVRALGPWQHGRTDPCMLKLVSRAADRGAVQGVRGAAPEGRAGGAVAGAADSGSVPRI